MAEAASQEAAAEAPAAEAEAAAEAAPMAAEAAAAAEPTAEDVATEAALAASAELYEQLSSTLELAQPPEADAPMAAAATRAAAGAFAQALALRVSRAQLLPPPEAAPPFESSGRSLLLLPDDGALAAAAAARRRAAIAPHLARVVHDVHRGGGAAPTAHLEYFGTLKTICKAEERRKLRKKQRRFVQYLVKFGLDADEIAAFA